MERGHCNVPLFLLLLTTAAGWVWLEIVYFMENIFKYIYLCMYLFILPALMEIIIYSGRCTLHKYKIYFFVAAISGHKPPKYLGPT